jgi:hypothetical protein
VILESSVDDVRGSTRSSDITMPLSDQSNKNIENQDDNDNNANDHNDNNNNINMARPQVQQDLLLTKPWYKQPLHYLNP